MHMPLPLLLAAMQADPQGPRNAMAADLPGRLQEASPSDFAMDWVEYTNGKGFSSISEPRNSTKPACGSYDAIIVLDLKLKVETQLLPCSSGIRQ